jgi:hypothetical protein
MGKKQSAKRCMYCPVQRKRQYIFLAPTKNEQRGKSWSIFATFLQSWHFAKILQEAHFSATTAQKCHIIGIPTEIK